MTSKYAKFRRRWQDCGECELADQRRRIVFTRGTLPCDVLFIGEAPGVSEDATGIPFEGPAGHLLDNIVTKAVETTDGADALRLAFTNLVCCFPREGKKAGNHEPPLKAIKACLPRLQEFAAICKPSLVVLVGNLASKHIPGASTLRADGKPRQPSWIGVGRSCLFAEIVHPAAILRADKSQQGLAIQRCVVTLADAFVDALVPF